MDRQRIVNLLAAVAAITVFGFTFGLMFPLLSLMLPMRLVPSATRKTIRRSKRYWERPPANRK